MLGARSTTFDEGTLGEIRKDNTYTVKRAPLSAVSFLHLGIPTRPRPVPSTSEKPSAVQRFLVELQGVMSGEGADCQTVGQNGESAGLIQPGVESSRTVVSLVLLTFPGGGTYMQSRSRRIAGDGKGTTCSGGNTQEEECSVKYSPPTPSVLPILLPSSLLYPMKMEHLGGARSLLQRA